MNLKSTIDPTASSARLHVTGDLDYVTTSGFVDAVWRLLADQPTLRNLHLDSADLTFCDSAGFSGLLSIHRQTSATGIRLHLDRRPAQLDRLLEITGILDHLTARPDARADAPDETVG